MATTDIASTLRESPMFARCSLTDLQDLATRTRPVTVESGVQLVHEGRRDASEFFVIVSGHAKVEKRYRAVAEIGPGDVFGELALLVDRPRNCTVTAITEMDLLVLDRRAFDHAMTNVAGLALHVARALATRLSDVEDALI